MENKYKNYQTRHPDCYKRDCFVPFSGNGIKICRLWELGRCPEKYREKVITKKKTIDIWIEGYRTPDGIKDAEFLGSFEADDFDDALNQLIQSLGIDIVVDFFGKGRHAIYGCELFDNEYDARKSFG